MLDDGNDSVSPIEDGDDLVFPSVEAARTWCSANRRGDICWLVMDSNFRKPREGAREFECCGYDECHIVIRPPRQTASDADSSSP